MTAQVFEFKRRCNFYGCQGSREYLSTEDRSISDGDIKELRGQSVEQAYPCMQKIMT